MRFVRMAGTAALLLGLAAGCKKESDDASVRSRLVGTWDTDFTAFDADSNYVLRESEKSYFPPTSHLLYRFSDTGVLAVGDSGATNLDRYLWTVSTNGTSVRLISVLDSSRPLFYRIHTLTDKALILEDTAASGVVSWLGLSKNP